MNLKKNMLKCEKYLSKYACLNKDAIRLKPIIDDFRPQYFKDIDRVIYTLSYTRYIDKTQVFSFKENDHLTKRIIHVQLVSKIARTIGRALNLNEDLIEAASLGHDLGHVPFGHAGEKILNEISLEYNEGYFNHNIQSVRLLMFLENNGKGSNLTVQTLDAIMCHNGEVESNIYKPYKKTVEQFLNEYNMSYTNPEIIKNQMPMTLEGCVVRISDIIAYLGRDIEDAIRLKLITINDIPIKVRNVLGTTNSQIIDTIINDIIKNSYNKPYIKISNQVYEALSDLKKFNYEFIYNKANSKKQINSYKKIFKTLFKIYLEQIESKNKKYDINKYILEMDEYYQKNTKNTRKVIDFISGMTDDYIVEEYMKYRDM